MKSIKSLVLIASMLVAQHTYASDGKHEVGEKLYKTHCVACHGTTGGMDFNKRIAPPIAAVRMHYIDAHPNRTDFVNAIADWVEKQDESKTLMRGAIRRFGIMPPVNVEKEDVKKIATYIYEGDIDKPEGFEKHVQEEHAKKGKIHKKRHGNHGERKHSGKDRMMASLHLTLDQQTKFEALMREKKSIVKPLKKQLRQIKQTIKNLDTSSSSYKADIFSLAEKKARLVHRMVIEKGEMRMKLDSILSPEQRVEFKSLKANKKRYHRKKHCKRGMGQ